MEIRLANKSYGMIVLGIFIFTALVGCSGYNAPPPNPVAQPQQPPAPSEGSSYGSAATSPQNSSYALGAKFFQFSDIPLPSAMTVLRNKSYVFEHGQNIMGFLILRGRVDPASVANYFVASLPQEGWRLKSQFRCSRSVLIFEKPGKICVILLKEGVYYTYAEVYVSPAART